jgi:hypothetical protein
MKRLMGIMAWGLVLALVGPGWAQPGPGRGGGMGARLYNPQTVTTVKGKVEKLEEINMGRRMAMTEVLLKTDQGSLRVHLGPNWYLSDQKFSLKAGDTLEATGSKVTLAGQPMLIAREVKVQGKTLKLRDDQGVPAWRGRGGGAGLGPGMNPGRAPAGK